MLQTKESLNVIEKNYNLEKNSLARTVFPVSIINSVCSLEKDYDELDGNDFYVIINSRENTNCMVFQKRADSYYKSSLFYIDWLSIKDKIDELKPVKVVIEISHFWAEKYFYEARAKYPHIEFIPIKIDKDGEKILIAELINLFEQKKIFLPIQNRVRFKSFLENEDGYIPCAYEEWILTIALLAVIENGI